MSSTEECKYIACKKPAVPKGESAHPFCSHNCGIGDYYHRQDVQYRKEHAEWSAKDPATRGPFETTVWFD
jgi:endogenous inhibitor of DNA gyrase (YacG/DUF329 family)